MGVLDGWTKMDLAVSLTFGGRKIIGFGFEYHFILRYNSGVFAAAVDDAVKVLIGVPSHMSLKQCDTVDKKWAL